MAGHSNSASDSNGGPPCRRRLNRVPVAAGEMNPPDHDQEVLNVADWAEIRRRTMTWPSRNTYGAARGYRGCSSRTTSIPFPTPESRSPSPGQTERIVQPRLQLVARGGPYSLGHLSKLGHPGH